jgi:hypothetical protein
MKNDDNQMGVHLDLICCHADDFTLLGIKIGNRRTSWKQEPKGKIEEHI